MAAQTYDVTVTGAGNASLRRSRRARKRQKSFAFGKRARASRGRNTRFSGAGITFTFGGLTTTGRGEVLNTEGNVFILKDSLLLEKLLVGSFYIILPAQDL